jgi:hypothetical protein
VAGVVVASVPVGGVVVVSVPVAGVVVVSAGVASLVFVGVAPSSGLEQPANNPTLRIEAATRVLKYLAFMEHSSRKINPY